MKDERRELADVRAEAWQTRREKYGPRGHGGAYGRRKPHDGALALIIELHREGVLSEGQVAQATGLDRVEIRRRADALPEPQALRSQPSVEAWRPMETAPRDQVIIAMARYRDATAGAPAFVAFIEGEWRELGRTLMEPMVCWAWKPRDVLGEWPQEARQIASMYGRGE